MYHAQQSLIHYLKNAALGVTIYTIKEYAAALSVVNEDEVLDFTAKLPAVLVYFKGPFLQDGESGRKAYGHEFQIFVITETMTFDETYGHNINLQAVEKITDFLRNKKNADFSPQGAAGTYVIKYDQVVAYPFVSRPRFTIHYIICPIFDHTKIF